MCHGVTGGALWRVLMKDSKGKFKRTEMEALGYRADLENVCKRCHEHPNTPFKPSLDPKYKFNYEERKKKVHNAEKYYNEDNKDQIITRDKNGVSVHAPGYTDTHPLPIEKWEVVDGKFKKIVWPFWSKKKKKIVWKGLKKVGKVAKKKIETRSSDGRYIDNGDGTITDTKSGLMWTKKDSYADLGKCLDWNDSTDYVSKLGTGGFKDWRMPSVSELKTIYEESKSSNLSYDHNPKVLLHLDSIFADGAAYWYWSSEAARKCCAVEFHFNSGKIDDDARKSCNDRGVRAVRLGR
jgi:hypothetical protein